MKQTLRLFFPWHTIIFVFGSTNCVRSPRAIPVHYFDSTGHATQVCEIQLFILCFSLCLIIWSILRFSFCFISWSILCSLV